MSGRKWMAVAIAALAITAGCSHTRSPKVATAASGTQVLPSSTASPMPSPAADPGDRLIQFQQCMHNQGVEVEIDGNGKPQIAVSPGSSKEKPDTAIQACRMYAPNGAEKSREPVTPEDIEKLRQFSQCIREHGFPDFPDPDPETGGVNLSSMGAAGNDIKANPQFRQAAQACQNFLPNPPASDGANGGKK